LWSDNEGGPCAVDWVGCADEEEEGFWGIRLARGVVLSLEMLSEVVDWVVFVRSSVDGRRVRRRLGIGMSSILNVWTVQYHAQKIEKEKMEGGEKTL
jgi:hypothetical protein